MELICVKKQLKKNPPANPRWDQVFCFHISFSENREISEGLKQSIILILYFRSFFKVSRTRESVLAAETKSIITRTEIGLDNKWGLDHGCWSVIIHLYPKVDVPVIEMSLDYSQTPRFHYDLARELSSLRKKGILIIGSGNMVHNLGMLAWDRLNSAEYGYDWAVEANEIMKRFILSGDHKSMIDLRSQGKAFNLAIPTPEHYLPLIYTLALKDDDEKLTGFVKDKIIGGLHVDDIVKD